MMKRLPDAHSTGLMRLVLLSSTLIIGVGLLWMNAPGTPDIHPERATVPVREPPPAIPIRLRIPRLQVDAPIIPVGVERDGAMGIPTSAEEVGWFSPGVKPGNTGNAVLAGHLDTVLGTAGVFSRLSRLQPGDTITVEDGKGITYAFLVRRTDIYPENHAPLHQIFGGSSGAQLRLITCHGPWGGHTYTERLVVTAVKQARTQTVSLKE